MAATMGDAAWFPPIAARAEREVNELRASANWIGRQLLAEELELLDLEGTSPEVKRRILSDVEWIVRFLHLYRFWTHRVGRMILAARRSDGEPVRVLDVGAGSGGFLWGLCEWASRRGIAVELYGIDRDARIVEPPCRAVRRADRRVEMFAADARALPFAAGAMHVVVTTLMLHHLRTADAAQVLHEMDRVAAVNLFAFDLRRNLAALPALWALLRAGRFPAPTRHDALLSLRKGYTVAEMEVLCRSASRTGLSVTKLPPAFYVVTRLSGDR